MSRNPLQILYLALHRRVFARRLRDRRRFEDFRVVSVGNLSAGGTGKTPAVALLAAAARDRKRKPMIVLRGYRGSASAGGLLVSDGSRLLAGAREAGDEAVLLAGKLSGVRVAVGRDRVSVLETHAGGGTGLVLLDDAFQNPAVFRDFDLVLIDASIPPDRLRLLPTGRFREDIDALERASAVLLTRVDQAAPGMREAWERVIGEKRRDLPVFASAHKPGALLPAFAETDDPRTGRGRTDSKRGGPLGAFCGLGNPRAFRETLIATGQTPAEFRAFPDHHLFRTQDLKQMLGGNSWNWVTTEKDLVRLREIDWRELPADFRHRLFVLPISLEIYDKREREFLDLVLGG